MPPPEAGGGRRRAAGTQRLWPARKARRLLSLCACLGLTALLPAPPAARAAEQPADVREAVKMLERLERTCAEYTGADSHKLLNAMVLEGVRLYEEAKYDPALDSILLGWALYPKEVPRTFYGLQPRTVEIAVRWPTPEEAGLLPVDAAKYTWVMVAAANLSGVRLELRGLGAAVAYEGSPVRDTAGNPVRSLAPDDAELVKAAGPAVLAPPAANHGETVTFPVVFPAFGRWTEMRFEHGPNRISVPVWNYWEKGANLARQLRARELARDLLAKRAPPPEDAKPAPEGGPKEPPPRRESRYVLIGYIRNEIAPGRYGIQVLARETAAQHTRFYICEGDTELAELKAIGSGTIAELVPGTHKPKPGDAVYGRKPTRQKPDKEK